MRTYHLYQDTTTGLTAIAACKTSAWMMIRSKCKEYKRQVPTFEQVTYVRQLTVEETKKMYHNHAY